MRFVVSLILFCSISFYNTFAQSAKSLLRQGNNKYKDKKYQDSEILYRKALEKNPKEERAKYNLGNALYRQNKFSEARQKYMELLNSLKDSKDKSSVLFNIGNALLKEKNYKESIDFYKRALKLNPKDFDAKYNLEYARKMLIFEQEQKNKYNQRKEENNNQNQQKQQQSQAKNQENDQKQNQNQEQSKQPNLSQRNIENILNALRNEEKMTQKEIKAKLLPRKEKKVDKNW